MLTVVATQWHKIDEDGVDTEEYESPIIYIDADDAAYELSITEATALLDALMLAVLQAREWAEDFISITGVTPNFIYSLKATVGHTGGVYAQD